METIPFLNRSGAIVRVDRPEWADDPKLHLNKQLVDKYNRTKMTVHPRMQFEGQMLTVDVILPPKDVLFHFFLKKPCKTFDVLLGEVVEAHFGNTNGFSAVYTPEVDSWGLKAEGLQQRSLYSLKAHVEDFLMLVDRTLELADVPVAGKR